MQEASHVVATSSSGLHRPGDLEVLQSCGFTHIVTAGVSNGAETKAEIDLAHELGLKYIIRWPDWARLGMLGRAHAFRAADGRDNVEQGPLGGPSHWNTDADKVALASLMALAETGADGVLIHMLVGDRPFPTGWYGLRASAWHVTAFWCWDPYATCDWEAHGTGDMCRNAKEGWTPAFYQWYQGAWIRRLKIFSEAALAVGLSEVWSWFIPLLNPTAANLADATAGSERPLGEWLEIMERLGAHPLLVVAHLFGIGSDGDAPYQAVERLAGKDWPLIVGLEACSPGGLINVRKNSATVRRWGAGCFAAEGPFLADPKGGREALVSGSC